MKKRKITLIYRKLTYDQAMLIKNKNHKVIIVDERQTLGQKRFNVAHELAHDILEHEGNIFTSRKAINLKDKSSTDQQADIFASELLIPTPVLKRKAHKYNYNLGLLARKFKVTRQAMITKMKIKKIYYNDNLYKDFYNNSFRNI
jgi:Zn-dependent peptidase ImmA (M78 family)